MLQLIFWLGMAVGIIYLLSYFLKFLQELNIIKNVVILLFVMLIIGLVMQDDKISQRLKQ